MMSGSKQWTAHDLAASGTSRRASRLVALLLARSLGLASVVALAILLVAQLLSLQ
jgi:hypothetical protein